MHIQKIQQQKIQEKQNPQFKGFGDGVLRFLATNQAIGANAVDVGFMVAPRTGTDFIERGPNAGFETLRREASGTTNHTLIGVYGGLSGAVIAALLGLNSQFGFKVNNLFTAPETLEILAENKSNQLKNNLSQLDYLKETLSNVKAFNPASTNADKDGFVKLSKETIDDVANLIDKSLKDKVEYAKWEKKDASNGLKVITNKIIGDTGAESKITLTSKDGKIISNTNLKSLLEDIFKVSDSFNSEKIKEAFKEQIKDNKSIKENLYIQKASKFMKTRSIMGFLIGSAIGMSIQPLNIYLTKKKTGSDGFVGVEGRSKDNSTQFKLLKLGAGAGFLGLTMATLGTGFKGFMDKMAFKGFWPTINQLKGIYGLTIISRLLAARDKDELRESLTKDFLGYLSWLVLGDFVNKMVAEGLDKSVMNRTKDIADKNFFGRVFNSSLKTRDEILVETLSKNGIETVKKDGDKTIIKSYKELTKELEKLPEQIKNVTKKRLKTLNRAQCAGYLFSGLVLGLGIPRLNIYITNKLDKKRKAQQAELQNQAQLAKA